MTNDSHILNYDITSIGGGDNSLVYNNLTNNNGALSQGAVRHNRNQE